MENYDRRRQIEKDLHMGKVMWVVNKAIDTRIFNTPYVKTVERFLTDKHDIDYHSFLADDDYSAIETRHR